MKLLRLFFSWTVVPAVAGVLLFPAPAGAQSREGRGQILGLTGHASLTGPGTEHAVRPGELVEAGALIRTSAGTAVDVFLGESAATVRLTENTVLIVRKLAVTGAEPPKVTEVELELQAGTVLVSGHRSGFDTSFQIKVSNGIAAIGDGQFRINARGFVVALDGTVVFAHAPNNAEPRAETLTAPPPVYFSPVEGGVRPAPAQLVTEVKNQFKARLRERVKAGTAQPPAKSAPTVTPADPLSQPDFERVPRRRL